MAPEMKRRKTVSLNAIVANNAFSEGRGKSRGSAKAVKRERVSETGSARRRGPDPEEIVEDKEVPVIEIEDDDDVFPDEDPDPAATVRERYPRLNPSSGLDTPSTPRLVSLRGVPTSDAE